MAFILRQAEEGTAVEEVCRKAGISIQIYYRRCLEVRRPKAVGDEAPAPAGGGEPAPEKAGGRPQSGLGHIAGRHSPKALRPARRARKPRRSTFAPGGRHACPQAHDPGLSHTRWGKVTQPARRFPDNSVRAGWAVRCRFGHKKASATRRRPSFLSKRPRLHQAVRTC